MEKALWYLLAGTRGGANRARIIRLLDDRPRNANQLAEALEVDYNTIRHYLDVLLDHDVVEAGGEDYGELYFLSDRFEANREAFGRIVDRVEFETEDESDDTHTD
ncbi:winged helix-turn-helix domain-containing protein [Halobellus clavatus]|uniref:Regulatory protein, arsR family n=1 Tax=Halobellus clavatus TaxID=660517 RepID=A0A1H3GXX9_9EURY|nr:winged helix-turn-helix domain-containing protein [Halobellus clavatus]SDY08101.1 regulatory protein, arsR family [Halobellus clavatus]